MEQKTKATRAKAIKSDQQTPDAVYLDRELDLNEAKLRFLMAANNLSPFGVVRRRPLASIGVAFLAGFGLSLAGGSKAAPSTLSTMSQIAGLVANLAPLFAARARSSGG